MMMRSAPQWAMASPGLRLGLRLRLTAGLRLGAVVARCDQPVVAELAEQGAALGAGEVLAERFADGVAARALLPHLGDLGGARLPLRLGLLLGGALLLGRHQPSWAVVDYATILRQPCADCYKLDGHT